MNNKVKIFTPKKRKLLIYGGILAVLAGITLAYFTGNAEPWGAIGGVISAIGLLSVIYSGFSKNQ